MPSYSFIDLPEVFPTSEKDKDLVAAGLKAGAIRGVRKGLYTTNVRDPLEDVVARNRWQIVSLLCPGTTVSHRTAFYARATPNGTVTVTGTYARRIDLPGMQIHQLKGPGPKLGTRPFLEGLFISVPARALLECLSGKVYGDESPYLSAKAIEEYLDRQSRLGVDVVNKTRDEARELSGPLGLPNAFQRLDQIVGALQGTRKARLQSKPARARAAGQPYDAQRIELFQALLEELQGWTTATRPETDISESGFRNSGFYDAYFSNYIEGTEFAVDEAMEIAYEGKIPPRRPKDAHDVLGTFKVLSSHREMSIKVSELEYDDFEKLLTRWHTSIMEGRPEARPGQFKEVANRAGRTLFVEPPLVRGTLHQGFQMQRALPNAFGRAAFLLFLISEVHPFDDGNGRVSRAVMNAELVSHDEKRILVPTVFRTEYIDALRVLSLEKQARTFARMLDYAQEFSADIDFGDLDRARERLGAWHAFDEDSNARLRRP